MTTDLYLLPPDEWPDEELPTGPPTPGETADATPHAGRRATALLTAVAVGAAAALAIVAPRVLGAGRRGHVAAVAASPTGASTAAGTARAEAPLASDPARAVYLVTVDDCGLQGTGSGFAIDAHHVVTNAHVVRADAVPQLRSPAGDRFVGRVVGITDAGRDGLVDPEGTGDVALIEVDAALPFRLAWGDGSPAVGDVLNGMTFPGSVYTPTTGTVVEVLRQGFGIRGDFDHGSSGGPVLTRNGRVAGIVTGGVEGGGRAFAFNAATLRPLVENMLAAPRPVPSDCGGG